MRSLPAGFFVRRPDLSLLLAFAFLSIFFTGQFAPFANPNELSRLQAVYSFVENGTFAIDGAIAVFGDHEDKSVWDGHFYSNKAPGLTFAAIPVYRALRVFFPRPESRFAPVFHTNNGLTHQQVVAAVLRGLERGRKDFGISSGLIICAMRNMDVSLEMAELAVDFRARGVVGFDLAGEEGGHPPKKHVDAFHYIQRENFNITIHAGEGYGKESIWQAIQYCGAHRIGHGTRLIDDIAVVDGRAVKLGDLAQYVLDKRIPLEICLLSNVHTGATPSLAEHPFKILYQEKFRVTLNTDNRLMSSTSMTREFEAAAETFGLSLDDFEKITINAMKSAFLPYKERCNFIYSIIKPGYAKMRQQQTAYQSSTTSHAD